ncbi:MAG TPA: 4-hydroxy-3-methylbut-2-enyl diphosphate reductase [Candidatus Methylomirabilis sp.]|nr:4-hydroxy-3-methylbut-2-enyl diphosphate reductase [Candidatus Methylomirabilis sp.]
MGIERVILAAPRGFCAGVDRAIDIVNLALQLYGTPVYVRKEIVHNAHVVQELRGRGAVFVDELDEVPDGGRVIFSAHGISPQVRTQAAAKGLQVIDATCPLVTKVHLEALKFTRDGRWIILVGHAGHDEVIGTMGHVPGRMALVGSVEEAERVEVPDSDRVSVITQTTLSIDDTRDIIAVLRRRFPKAVFPPKDDICYATQNRQMAVKEMAGVVDLLLVIGSPNSSNSMRLVEVAQAAGVRAYLIDDISEMDPRWLEGVRTVGITAGASAPEHLVQEAVEFFRRMGVSRVEEVDGIREDVVFALPPEIQRDLPPGVKMARSLKVSGQP